MAAGNPHAAASRPFRPGAQGATVFTKTLFGTAAMVYN